MNIIDEEFRIEPNRSTGLYDKAKGGTEILYESLKAQIDPNLFDKFQIICSRVRDLNPHKKRILWCSDTYDDPENSFLQDEKNHDLFEKIIFVSQTQFIQYHMAFKIPYQKSAVLLNAIHPIQNIRKPKDEIRLVYHTTPHRGLGLLVPAFEYLVSKYPDLNLVLDVFSNFDIYGWPKRNEPFEPLFQRCIDHAQINYHGTQPNDVVRDSLAKSHIFAYPCIWPETSCLAAIEAMSAGCAVVCPDYGALPETVFDQRFMYRYTEDPMEHLKTFLLVLEQAILTNEKNSFTSTIEEANMRYGWEHRVPEWKTLLENIHG